MSCTPSTITSVTGGTGALARLAGIASGVNNAVARVAALVGIAAVGVAVAGRSGAELDLAGFRIGMILTAALVAAGGIVGLIGIQNPSNVGRGRSASLMTRLRAPASAFRRKHHSRTDCPWPASAP
jgi:hypothetical protein